MAQGKKNRKGKSSGKVGSDPEAIHDFGGKGDFGVAATPGKDRDYVARNTKASDPGATQPRSAEHEGVRTHGAGGTVSGEGSSSGGDLDTDIIGVGTGGSGFATPTDYVPRADDTDGSSDEMGSGRSRGDNQDSVGNVGGPRPVHRTMPRANLDETAPGAGSDSATSQASGDDAFVGEVSSGEARGEDEDPDQAGRPA